MTTTEILAVVEPPTVDERARPRPGRLVFGVCALAYLALAWWFWDHHLIPSDAISRVANAYYVLFSRDPHLAAVGIIWNPLPSLVLLPVLPLAVLMPTLAAGGLVAAIASALFMALTVAVGHDILERLGVARWPRIGLTVLLAAHPMTLVYAGNGLSEALFLLFLMLSVRGLTLWLHTGRSESLMGLGLALGLAYATRYEAIAPGVAVPVVVALVSAWRARDRTGGRAALALTDAALAGLPFAASVGLWALASKIVGNEWFATFTSEYGNSAQVAANLSGIRAATGETVSDRISYAVQQALGLEPLVVVLLFLAALAALRRRDPRVLAPVTVLGAVLAFDLLVFVAGMSFGWLRFQITIVPLTTLLAGLALATPPTRGPLELLAANGSYSYHSVPRSRAGAWPAVGRWRPALVAATLLCVVVALPAAAVTLRSPSLAREESFWLTGGAQMAALAGLNERIAGDLDAMGLPDGSVVTDSAYSFAIILASRHPKQFVINSDRDFPVVLADPAGRGARYLLISTAGAADAVRAAHPGVGAPALGRRTWSDDSGAVAWTLVPVT